jgi:hypothetical protein
MKITHVKIVSLLIVLLGIAACDTVEPELDQLQDKYLRSDPQPLFDAGAKRLSAEQTKQHVSGNTEFWDEGAVYYAPDGKLQMLWLRIHTEGAWEMQADGTICFEVPEWRRSCHFYLAYDGAITTVENGKVSGVLIVKPGKHLDRQGAKSATF